MQGISVEPRSDGLDFGALHLRSEAAPNRADRRCGRFAHPRHSGMFALRREGDGKFVGDLVRMGGPMGAKARPGLTSAATASWGGATRCCGG